MRHLALCVSEPAIHPGKLMIQHRAVLMSQTTLLLKNIAGDDEAAKRKKALTFVCIAKVIYFCVGINGACARSFLAIFLKDADLSYASVGIYFAATSAAIAVSTPLFGILLERTRYYSFFLKVLSALTVISSTLLLLQFFAYGEDSKTAEHNKNIFITTLKDIKQWLKTILPVSGSNLEPIRLQYFVVTGILLSAFSRASSAVRDAAVMDVIKNSPRPHKFTYDRVRGVLSLAMGLSNICCGALLAYTTLQNYQLWFFSTLPLFFLTGLTYPFSNIWQKYFKVDDINERANRNPGKDAMHTITVNHDSNIHSSVLASKNRGSCEKMYVLLSKPTMLVFLLVSIVNGMGNATYDIYIILRLKQLHASFFLIGVTAGLGSLTNFVFFYLTPYIKKRIGNRWMIVISMMTFCIRSGIYSMIDDTNYAIVLVAQSLHGLNFSVMFA